MRQLTMIPLCVAAAAGAVGCIALDEDGSEARDSVEVDDSGEAEDTGDGGGSAEVLFSDVLDGAALLPEWDGTCGVESLWDCCDNLTLTLATTAEEAQAILDDELDGACCVDGVDFSADSVLIAYTEGCPGGPEDLSFESILQSATGDLSAQVVVTIPTDVTDAAWRPYAAVAISADEYAGVTGSAEIVWVESE